MNRFIAIIFLASLAACGKPPESPRIDRKNAIHRLRLAVAAHQPAKEQ